MGIDKVIGYMLFAIAAIWTLTEKSFDTETKKGLIAIEIVIITVMLITQYN